MYAATPKDTEPFEMHSSHSYAVKIVTKGETRSEIENVEHIQKEFKVYCKIEEAKRTGKMKMSVTPGCYGLYRSKTMMALVLDSEGEALTEEEWKYLSPSDRCAELIVRQIRLRRTIAQISYIQVDIRSP